MYRPSDVYPSTLYTAWCTTLADVSRAGKVRFLVPAELVKRVPWWCPSGSW